MKLRTKMTLLTTLLLLSVLIIVNAAVCGLFIASSLHAARTALQQSATELEEKYGARSFLERGALPVSEQEMPDGTMLRVLAPDGTLLNEASNAASFILPKQPSTAWNPSSGDGKTSSSSTLLGRMLAASGLNRADGEWILTVRLPLSDGNSTGTMELLQNMERLEASVSRLVLLLAGVSLAGVVLCLVCGMILSRTIMQPVVDLMRTMEDISGGHSLRRIPALGKSKTELEALADAFNRMVDRLEDSFQRQRQFTADASHELGTSITILEGYASMLQRWGLEHPESARESILTISEEARRMKHLTGQLLELAELDRQPGLKLQTFDLIDCCRSASRLAAGIDGREITVRPAIGQLDICADRDRLLQVILILVENALKYSSDSVEIEVNRTAEVCELRVLDRGPGIPIEDRERVFDRFYRVAADRSRSTGGSGLGLSIARMIIMEHGGSISISDRSGGGMIITVCLPISTAG